MKTITQKPDAFGAFASALCFVHCIGTPLIFISHSCTSHGCETAPLWWKSLDFIFLTISFVAIHFSVKRSSNSYIKRALWFSWTLLFTLTINSKMNLISLPEIYTNAIAVSLAGLHLYNMSYCQCKTDKCCINNG